MVGVQIIHPMNGTKTTIPRCLEILSIHPKTQVGRIIILRAIGLITLEGITVILSRLSPLQSFAYFYSLAVYAQWHHHPSDGDSMSSSPNNVRTDQQGNVSQEKIISALLDRVDEGFRLQRAINTVVNMIQAGIITFHLALMPRLTPFSQSNAESRKIHVTLSSSGREPA